MAPTSDHKEGLMKQRWTWVAVLGFAIALAVAGAAAAHTYTSAHAAKQLTKVTLQSKWVVQSQFAGYYVAKAKGFYKAHGLAGDTTAGGPDSPPDQVGGGNQAEFGIAWLPSLHQQRDTGKDLVNI